MPQGVSGAGLATHLNLVHAILAGYGPYGYNSLSPQLFLGWATFMRRFWVGRILATAALAAALAGCSASAISGKLPGDMGEPADTPARPTVAYQYPAVHDMPPPRADQPLTDERAGPDGKGPRKAARPSGGPILPPKPPRVAKSPPRRRKCSRQRPKRPKPLAARATRDKSQPGFDAEPFGRMKGRRPRRFDDGRLLPHPPLAALRVRRGEPGRRPARATPAPTSSTSAWAIPTCQRPRTSSKR